MVVADYAAVLEVAIAAPSVKGVHSMLGVIVFGALIAAITAATKKARRAPTAEAELLVDIDQLSG